MQLQIDVNSVKSTIFLELLNLFKKDRFRYGDFFKLYEYKRRFRNRAKIEKRIEIC